MPTWTDFLPGVSDDLANTSNKTFQKDEVWVFKLGPIAMIFKVTDAQKDLIYIERMAGADTYYDAFRPNSTFASYCQLLRDTKGTLTEKSALKLAKPGTAIIRTPDVCKCPDNHPHNERGCLMGMCGCRVAK